MEKHPRHINGYLMDAADVFVSARSQKQGPLSPMLNLANFGSMPLDGGNLLIDDCETYEQAMADPIAVKYVRPFRGSRELINGIDRWCLWLVDAEPSDMRRSKFIASRITAIKSFREQSTRAATREHAETPWLFGENHQPEERYLAIPKVFSGRREYATCACLDENCIASDLLFTSPDPDGFAFAIIESSMFMTWQKAIGGRLKSDCRFSNTVVWNTLPLPKLDDNTRADIVNAGKEVLAARAKHPNQSLADSYDPDFMPQDLRKAHESLDKVVDQGFGAPSLCESNEQRLEILFQHYSDMNPA